MNDNLIELPMAEAKRLHLAAQRGDEDALATLTGFFDDIAECFICGGAAERHARTHAIFSHPHKKGFALVAPECAPCVALPKPERDRRVHAMLKSMWPRTRWQSRKDMNPSYMKGGPPKKRKA